VYVSKISGGSVTTADWNLHGDIRINIRVYIHIFTRKREHRREGMVRVKGEGGCDPRDGESDFSNRRIRCEIMI